MFQHRFTDSDKKLSTQKQLINFLGNFVIPKRPSNNFLGCFSEFISIAIKVMLSQRIITKIEPKLRGNLLR